MRMLNTFFWHDYETFGAIPRCDRPAQFAGIRTDMGLNEIGEPVMVYCKPSPDSLPSPEACLITGITPLYCEAHGLMEREFAAIIERELGKANTIGVGFNSIRFDDEVTRYLFWRNLIDPYRREWDRGCSRWDLMDVTRALYALKPKAIQWPYHEDGRVSFKLEHLSQANGLTHESAHDALSDVRATIALARLIQEKEPRFFNFCLKLRNKEEVRRELSLMQKRPLLHISGMYSNERACLAVVWPIAIHPTNKNEVIVWDLAENPMLLSDLSVEEIKLRLFSRNEDLPENIQRLPIKTISLNKSPFVVNDLRVLSDARAADLGIDLALIHEHAKKAENLRLAPDLWGKVYERAPYEALDVDENLYGGFIAASDRPILDRIRRMKDSDLAKARDTYQDPRLSDLVFRYRARNFPESLSLDEMKQWLDICVQKNEPKLADYWKQFETLYETLPATKKPILDELKQWVLRQPYMRATDPKPSTPLRCLRKGMSTS